MSPGIPLSPENLREKTIKALGHNPCHWQSSVVKAILGKDKDVILTAATGSGKTLTFWMPLLALEGGIQIVCTPLNLLGTVNVASLVKRGIPAISVTAETATPANFRVSTNQ